MVKIRVDLKSYNYGTRNFILKLKKLAISITSVISSFCFGRQWTKPTDRKYPGLKPEFQKRILLGSNFYAGKQQSQPENLIQTPAFKCEWLEFSSGIFRLRIIVN
jgi:FAD synthase